MNTPKGTKLTFGVFFITFSLALVALNFDFGKNTCDITTSTKTVRGHSMSPQLENGQDINVQEGYYACYEPAVGEVVLVSYAKREVPLVKIIKAVPQDHFALIEENNVYYIKINGQILTNSAKKNYVLSSKEAEVLKLYERDYKQTIPENAYLVLGDNVDSSLDSTEFGLVGRSSLLGKVIDY